METIRRIRALFPRGAAFPLSACRQSVNLRCLITFPKPQYNVLLSSTYRPTHRTLPASNLTFILVEFYCSQSLGRIRIISRNVTSGFRLDSFDPPSTSQLDHCQASTYTIMPSPTLLMHSWINDSANSTLHDFVKRCDVGPNSFREQSDCEPTDMQNCTPSLQLVSCSLPSSSLGTCQSFVTLLLVSR
jgi:hypothetical protein